VKTVLFLCTANYYRSRFAEELFNHHAAHVSVNWQAHSRALAIERGRNNIGPLSPFVSWGLTARGLSAKGANRLPTQCTILDLESADYIVALNEAEHRPIIGERFPDWDSRIQYWEVDDVDLVQPNQAFALIDVRVDELLALFRASYPAA
jgi:protein-tyrosine phosphatase